MNYRFQLIYFKYSSTKYLFKADACMCTLKAVASRKINLLARHPAKFIIERNERLKVFGSAILKLMQGAQQTRQSFCSISFCTLCSPATIMKKKKEPAIPWKSNIQTNGFFN